MSGAPAFLHPEEKKNWESCVRSARVQSVENSEDRGGEGKGKNGRGESRDRGRNGRHHPGGSSYITLIVAIITIL